MNREYHKQWSPVLGREMETLLFGHAGPRLLVFPTRQQRFYEYEDRGMIASLQRVLESGALQVLCVDGIDEESLYGFDKPAEARLQRHLQYERYILEEVLPYYEAKNPGTPLIAHGCSLGAFHAMSIALRHPEHFHRIIAFSGRYDLGQQMAEFHSLFYGFDTEELAALMPSRFMPEVRTAKRLKAIRKLWPIVVIGEEDPFLEDNRRLCAAFRARKVPFEFHLWSGNAHRFRYWRQMIRVYLGLTLVRE